MKFLSRIIIIDRSMADFDIFFGLVVYNFVWYSFVSYWVLRDPRAAVRMCMIPNEVSVSHDILADDHEELLILN